MLQLSEATMEVLVDAYIDEQAAQWHRRIDAALPPGEERPAVRLAALAREVARDTQDLGRVSDLLSVDVIQTRDWLLAALQAGVPYDETLAAALLNAAAALGALWFIDDRLLPLDEQLPLHDMQTLPLQTWPTLMTIAQGDHFQLAADRGRSCAPASAMPQRVCCRKASPAMPRRIWSRRPSPMTTATVTTRSSWKMGRRRRRPSIGSSPKSEACLPPRESMTGKPTICALSGI